MIVLRNKTYSSLYQKEFGFFDKVKSVFTRTPDLGDPSIQNYNDSLKQNVSRGNSRQRRKFNANNPNSDTIGKLKPKTIGVTPTNTNSNIGKTFDFINGKSIQSKPKLKVVRGSNAKGNKKLRRAFDYNTGFDGKIPQKGDGSIVRRGRKLNQLTQGSDKLVGGRTKSQRYLGLSSEGKEAYRNKQRALKGRGISGNTASIIGDGNKLTKEQRIARLSNQRQVQYHRELDNIKAIKSGKISAKDLISVNDNTNRRYNYYDTGKKPIDLTPKPEIKPEVKPEVKPNTKPEMNKPRKNTYLNSTVGSTNKSQSVVGNKAVKNSKGLGKLGKVGLGIGLGTAATYAGYKLLKNNKNDSY